MDASWLQEYDQSLRRAGARRRDPRGLKSKDSHRLTGCVALHAVPRSQEVDAALAQCDWLLSQDATSVGSLQGFFPPWPGGQFDS
jgi:hypothetical protein